MTANDRPILPKEAQDALNNFAKKNYGKGKTKIFLGIPNMGNLNVSLWMSLFNFAQNQEEYELYFHFVVEKRHTDYARNVLVEEFLKTKCDYMAMLDADVAPNPGFLTLVKHDKDIIAANTHCWINDELIPSIWQKAACEQCFNLKKWMEEGVVHDPREYFVDNFEDNGLLYRWEPINQRWQNFANKSGVLGEMKCRCQGTGLDPWVFRMYQKPFEPGKIVQCDSVGSASMIVRRNVVEAMRPPHFMFLYRPSREILLTEDHYFCWVASTLGYTVWADLDMICGHYKTVNLAGINNRLIRAFQSGMEFQKKSDGEKYNIIIPTEEDIKKVAVQK